MKYLRVGLFRLDAQGRREWLKDRDGVSVNVRFAYKDMREEMFASATAKRLNLKRCIKLGEIGLLDVPPHERDEFKAELVALSRHFR